MHSEQPQLSEAQSAKLTTWKNEPSIQQLKADLEAAKPAHDLQVGKINAWNDLMFVRGSAKPKAVKGRSAVQPKLIRRQAEWRYSALTEPFLGNEKVFTINPTTFEDEAGAIQNELLLNWQFRTKLNRVKFVDSLIRATVDEGTSIVRLGWKRVTVPIEQEVPTFTHYAITTEEEANALQQAIEAKQNDPRTFNEQASPEMKSAVELFEETETPTVAKQTGTEKVTTEKVLVNHPTLEVKNPVNIFIDPSCGGDLDKALFVIESFETNKSELQKEGSRYKNLNRVNWEGNTPMTEPDHATTTPTDFNFVDAARKKVVAHEYWGFYDTEGDGVLQPVVITWIGDVIIRAELNPFPDEKVPYVVIPYLPVKRELMGEPDAELLEDNQKILGAVSRGMIDLLGRSANGQQGFAKGMLDPLNKRRYENGQDYEFNPNLTPQAGLIEHKYPEFPQSAFLMLNLQNQEAEALTGVKSFSGGMSGEAFGDVAAGIRGVLDAASKREMAILRRLAQGMVEIAQKICSMNAVFLSEEEVVRVTNSEYVTIKREDLKGNFDFEVDISTAEVDNAKAQDLSFLLQTIGNSMDIGITIMILSEIARLKRMPVLAKKIASFQPTPDPLVQKAKELEIEKLMAEVEEIRARARLADAKAVEAKTQAELNDLDFVEQDTGTKHAREIQKQQAQARGNQNLVVTKALATPRKEGEKEPDIEAAVGFSEVSEKLGGFEQPSVVDIPEQTSEMVPQS